MPAPALAHRRSRRARCAAAWLLSAGALLALRDAVGFVAARPGSAPARRLVARAASRVEQAVSPVEFVLGSKADGQEVDSLAFSLAKTGSSGLWDMVSFEPATDPAGVEIPKYERWLSEKQFLDAAKRVQPSASDETVQVVFITLAQGNSGYLQKEKVDGYLDSWGKESFNSGAFQGTMFTAKGSILFAYWFLNIFAPFCTYFFFLRAPIIQFAGIDLLPGTPRFWEKMPPPV